MHFATCKIGEIMAIILIMKNRTTNTNSFSFPAEVIQSMRNEFDRLDSEIKKKSQEIKTLNREKDNLYKLIQAAVAYSPISKKQRIIDRNTQDDTSYDFAVRGAWTKTIREIIEKSKIGISYNDLKEAVKKTNFAFKIEANENSVYSVVEKLVHQGRVVKYNGLLFSPSEYAEYKEKVKKGLIKENNTVSNGARPSPASDAIIAFLNEQIEGVDSAAIKAELSKDPQLKESLKHSSFIYTVLKRLTDKNLIKREGNLYYAAS
jgi:hypothetical protein